MLEVVEGDAAGRTLAIKVRSRRYVESDTALINRILGREVGGKQNILVMNDEAHHAYRIKREEPDEEEEDDFGEDEEAEEFFKEATVWIEGLDRINKVLGRKGGINFCVDLSATPYFLGRVGQQTNRPFPWVVSDFSLMDAIESGLVKIPQLAVRDTTGAEIPGYFNIWRWILQPGRLTPAERGGKHASPKPEAVLKWAHTPIAHAGRPVGSGARRMAERTANRARRCSSSSARTRRLANVVFDWLANGKCPSGIPPGEDRRLSQHGDRDEHHLAHSKVVHETDSDAAKSTNRAGCGSRSTRSARLRGRWIRQERPIYPDGFEELAKKLDRPLAPAGPGCALHCQRRHADGGLGLQHGDAHHRAAAVHVATPVRAGGGPRACAGPVMNRARTV